MERKNLHQHHSEAFWKMAKRKMCHDRWLPAEEVIRCIIKKHNVVYASYTLNAALTKVFTGEIHVARRVKNILQTTKEGKKKRKKRFYFISKSPLLPRDIPRESAPFQEAWDFHESTQYYQASLLSSTTTVAKQQNIGTSPRRIQWKGFFLGEANSQGARENSLSTTSGQTANTTTSRSFTTDGNSATAVMTRTAGLPVPNWYTTVGTNHAAYPWVSHKPPISAVGF
ncbi:unnamed protein product [Cylindrotheca closterium]|uniref:Uncharacterized protein n=1 Tax=Cylindrotheca closterium TaxID=2856 RepID=A0AAD2FGE2_9STRA|nr:unnamed protein product [Cylindrotheca closterium]